MVTTPQNKDIQKSKKAQVLVDLDVVETSFEKWAKPGHFSRTLAKGPKTTTWIWNLHADAHDFDLQSTPFNHSGIYPTKQIIYINLFVCKTINLFIIKI